MPFGNFSFWEIILLMVAVLLLFGAKRLPEMGRSLGKGMREFKDSVSGADDDRPVASPAELPPASSEPARMETEPVPAEKSERETVN